MNALAWPLTPVIGQVFKGFAWDGKAWGRAKPRLVAQWTNVQVFKTDGRYTPSDDLLYAIVECIGPGGGGGWCAGDLEGVSMTPTAAGGGGSGGYSRSVLPAEAVIQGADVAVPIGGIVSVGTVGGGVTAGDTSFGGIVVAHAGGNSQAFDGAGTIPSAHGLAGAGALPGTGDIALPGAAGGMWATGNINLSAQHLVAAIPGLGGQLFGGAAWPVPPWLFTNQNGRDGVANSGAGGGGAQVNVGSVATTTFGGRGGSGLVVVTEFCGTDDGGGPDPEPPGPGRPPGVPININAKVALTHVPFDPDAPYVDPRGKR